MAEAVPGVASKTHLGRNQGQDNSRLFTVAFLRYFLRICRMELQLFRGDLEMAIIAQAVAISSVEALMRDPEFKEAYRSMSTVIGVAGQRGVNVTSLAEATGLPRETVRRKLLRLVKLDIVAKRADGDYVMQSRGVQSQIGQGFLAALEAETLRFVNTCIDDGVFEAKANGPDRLQASSGQRGG